jgi:hypothetical protein
VQDALVQQLVAMGFDADAAARAARGCDNVDAAVTKILEGGSADDPMTGGDESGGSDSNAEATPDSDSDTDSSSGSDDDSSSESGDTSSSSDEDDEDLPPLSDQERAFLASFQAKEVKHVEAERAALRILAQLRAG